MAISSERIIGILEENGFTLCRVKGSHHHYKKEKAYLGWSLSRTRRETFRREPSGASNARAVFGSDRSDRAGCMKNPLVKSYKLSYSAILRKTRDSDWGVEFPDVPGCISAGKTKEEALAAAQEALQGHLDLLDELGEPVPQPRPIEESALIRYEEHEILHTGVIEIRPPARIAG